MSSIDGFAMCAVRSEGSFYTATAAPARSAARSAAASVTAVLQYMFLVICSVTLCQLH
jgi:hypothetical protein